MRKSMSARSHQYGRYGQSPILLADCSVLEATVKQTPIGDKYFIDEALREPKTGNTSQVIMVGLTFVHKINQLLLIKILRSPKARPASQFKEISPNGKLKRRAIS